MPTFDHSDALHLDKVAIRETQYPWLNLAQYPFRTREFDSGDGWMSYVDEGRGRPVVFVHGSPTWSYLYRHLIRGLAPYYRCIAPDHLGFGLSEKPLQADYRPEMQARRFADLMDYLNIKDCTLVVHDAGGPIALSWALDYPGRVRDLVLFNTWMWPLRENRPAMRLARLVGNPFNRFYYRALNASPNFILPALFADRHRIPKPTQVQYLEPFRKFKERGALYAMVESMRHSERWFADLYQRSIALETKRALILWGTKDPMLRTDYLEQWESIIPQHQTVRFPWIGRYVPEEGGRSALDEIRWFLMTSPALRVA